MLHLVDDFYPDPDEVRRRALELEYADGQKKGKAVNHPGARAINPWYSNMIYLRNRWETITGKKAIKFEYGWSNGAFNVGYKKQHLFNWVHGDHTKALEGDYMFWAAVIYLTPNPPCGTGTLLLEHKKTKAIRQYENDAPTKGDSFKEFIGSKAEDQWRPHITIENRYNRCVIYDGTMFHAPRLSSFGHNKETGRLTQLGFWQSEW
jgi:hypothetical protein